MKVVLCLKHFLPSHVAGTEVYVKGLASSLQAQGIEVLVVKPNYSDTDFSEYMYKGIKVLEYPESAYNDKALQTGKKAPTGLANFIMLLKVHQPDVVHFHEISGSNGITIHHLEAVKRLGIKVFTTLHLLRYVCKTSTLMYMQQEPCDGKIIVNKCAACMLEYGGLNASIARIGAAVSSGFNQFGYDLSLRTNKVAGLLSYSKYIEDHIEQLHNIFDYSHRVVVLNNWFRDILLRNGVAQEKMSVISRPEPDYATAFPAQETENKQIIKLIYIGRICRIKGLLLLLNALKELGQGIFSLDIFGNVTEQDYYQECLDLTKGQSNIHWRGVVEQEAVVDTLLNYDVLVFPSIVQEMSPFVTYEAFAAGLPVLASDILEARAVIKKDINGWIFKMNDIDSLKNSLIHISKHTTPVLAKRTNTSKKLIDFDSIAQAHTQLYIS